MSNPEIVVVGRKPIKSFVLGPQSISRLNGVKPALAAVIKRAIEVSKVDFQVGQGVRTLAEQKRNVASGASQTMKSKHLTGDAVDLIALTNGKVDWNSALYDDIADAVKIAAKELGTIVRWGGAWTVNDIRTWNGTMESAMLSYVDHQRKNGKRPFLDLGHFELM